MIGMFFSRASSRGFDVGGMPGLTMMSSAASKSFVVVLAEFPLDFQIAASIDGFLQFVLLLQVRDGNLGTLFGHVFRHCHARQTETNDQNFLTFVLTMQNTSYLNFSVDNVINAKRTEMIQKRTITLGSAQPFNSK